MKNNISSVFIYKYIYKENIFISPLIHQITLFYFIIFLLIIIIKNIYQFVGGILNNILLNNTFSTRESKSMIY